MSDFVIQCRCWELRRERLPCSVLLLTDSGQFLRQARENYHAMKIKASGVNQKIQSSKNGCAINFLCHFLLNIHNKVHCAIPSAPIAQAFQKISDSHEITTASSSRRHFEMFLINLHRPTAEAHGMLFISLLLALDTVFFLFAKNDRINK